MFSMFKKHSTTLAVLLGCALMVSAAQAKYCLLEFPNGPLYPHDVHLSWQEERLKNGESISSLLGRYGIAEKAVIGLVQENQMQAAFRSLQAGSSVKIATQVGLPCLFRHATIDLDAKRSIEIEQTASGLEIYTKVHDVEYRTAFRRINIEDSLHYDGQKARVPSAILNRIEHILSGQMDFNRELRTGDVFRIIYEEMYRNGKFVSYGDILALEYIGQDREITAVRFEYPGTTGYYTLDGKNLQTTFSRNPLPSARISSRYSKRRFHPLHKTFRPHKGVDFAAPIGTPIRATANGIVHSVRHSPSYGLVMVLQHGSIYRTLYAHMSKVRKGMRKGKRVKRGQVIGYVGNTGVSTGPHLHYELHRHKQQVNPLRAKLPTAAPVPEAHFAEFEYQAMRILSLLGRHETIYIAQAETESNSQ